MEKKIKKELEEISKFVTETSEHIKFSNKDLQNATSVFAFVVASKMWVDFENKDTCPEVRNYAANLVGKQLRDFVKQYTDVDLQKVN